MLTIQPHNILIFCCLKKQSFKLSTEVKSSTKLQTRDRFTLITEDPTVTCRTAITEDPTVTCRTATKALLPCWNLSCSFTSISFLSNKTLNTS